MEKLKVGILGMRRGMAHLHNFLAVEEAEVIGVADRLPDRQEAAEKVMREKGCQGKIVSEYDELLAMQPDAIVVASNGRAQCGHSVMALEAGCHVLSEVPGAFSLEEWLKIRDTSERSGKQYMMAENLCFMDFIRYWRKWIEGGQYGEISIAEAEYLHYLPATMTNAAGEFFTPSQVAEQGIKDVKPTWRADQPPIGYLTHDLGPLLEVLDDRVVSVSCRGAGWRCKEAPLRSDGQIALFHTAKGILIQILVTLNTVRPSEHRFRLFGTEGSLEWTLYEQFCKRFTKGRAESDGWEVVDIGLAARDTDPTTGHGGTDINLARNFTRCMLKNGTVPIDVYRSIEYSLPGIIAGQSADLGGAPLAIPDLRREAFVHTDFWNVVGFPEDEPEGRPFKAHEELG
ncbi:MAG: Gfo/Idh/MocA family oxidoreductase [Armatimonadia bacterium]